jgi:hypothetical protein
VQGASVGYEQLQPARLPLPYLEDPPRQLHNTQEEPLHTAYADAQPGQWIKDTYERPCSPQGTDGRPIQGQGAPAGYPRGLLGQGIQGVYPPVERVARGALMHVPQEASRAHMLQVASGARMPQAAFGPLRSQRATGAPTPQAANSAPCTRTCPSQSFLKGLPVLPCSQNADAFLGPVDRLFNVSHDYQRGDRFSLQNSPGVAAQKMGVGACGHCVYPPGYTPKIGMKDAYMRDFLQGGPGRRIESRCGCVDCVYGQHHVHL